MKQLLFVIDDNFIGFVCDKQHDFEVPFDSKEDAVKFAEYLGVDYLVVPEPEYAA